ncbi:uncharacterized protein ACLA_041160 [Aspergillus clavatus NRRL 1]|uniref:Antigenic cell wall galactomannoprotein n=1 Tax=Aspergillus clavatus (strain ATCC 1007 / CBS 513.65 / DSM 816 / NCTC 3887 / NRRL 1 / QM 1276 / 107) TaxID=344612 RepID=A1CL76_ASPCL|nr:uncharacterized protein ACLA_041160 [Aspergillus clavatus NRRL 1]EAW09900.1 conserved hypothetical protein [Aspergillus clavatus NRRL 1]
MRLSALLLPLIPLALATPNPEPVAAPAPQSSGGLLSQLPEIINGVKELLSQETLDDLQTVVKGGAVLLGGDNPQNIAKLLSRDNVNKLQDIVDNAHTLLTPTFANETLTLIGDATPLVSAVEKLLGGLLASLT